MTKIGMMMSRDARQQIGKISIELDLDDPAQRLVWEHWQSLTHKGEASAWAREMLQKGLPLLNIKQHALDGIQLLNRPISASKQLRVSDEPTYEDVSD